MRTYDMNKFFPEEAVYVRPVSQANFPGKDICGCTLGVFNRDGEALAVYELLSDVREAVRGRDLVLYTLH